MSLMLFGWLALFASCSLLALQRPAYGVAVYMLTYFGSPPFWWWGRPVEDLRWNFYGGLVLLGAVLINGVRARGDMWTGDQIHADRLKRRVVAIALLMLANLTIVNFAVADYLHISNHQYMVQVKFIVLFLLILASIRSKRDLEIVLISIVLGAAYIGYEVTVNDRGHVEGSRLEGVGIPSANTANDLACLMVSVLPMTGALFLIGRKWEKLTMLAAAPLTLNVLITCNSRGAFLAAFVVCIVILGATPPAIRSRILKLLGLGAIAAWLLLGDPRIVERFMTTFVSAEERDHSASSRLDFWKAGALMIAEQPFGSGGDSFKRVHGSKYIYQVTGRVEPARSVHNGYINDTCEWGVQGLALRLALLFTGGFAAVRAARAALRANLTYYAVLSGALAAGLAGFMTQSGVGTFLDNEWGFWLVAISIAVYQLAASEAAEELAADDGPQNCQADVDADGPLAEASAT